MGLSMQLENLKISPRLSSCSYWVTLATNTPVSTSPRFQYLSRNEGNGCHHGAHNSSQISGHWRCWQNVMAIVFFKSQHKFTWTLSVSRACYVCETDLSVQHLQKVKFNISNTNTGCETSNNDAQRTVLTQKTES